MFQSKTKKIEELTQIFPKRITELKRIFDKKTNIYIDFANVLGWQDRLNWHIDIKRLKQLFNSFDTISEVKFYYGTLVGDANSEHLIRDAERYGYKVTTKPVKIMRLPIDIFNISPDSPEILKEFIRAPLLQKLNIETIEFLNLRLKELNQQGIMYVEDLKCNFDVEIGRDMLLDYANNKVDNFILWSGDSDFADPIKQLLDDGKKVILFATARKVATELNALRSNGLFIFDIQKIRNFICWPREMKGIKAKRTQ